MQGRHPIIIYDGICKFCNGSVNMLVRLDKKRLFRYCHFQSSQGKKLMEENGVPSDVIKDMSSMVVLMPKGDKYEYKLKSSAILELFYLLGFPYSLMYTFILIPKFIRDAMYNCIAKNRYRLMGKYETCIIPTKKVKELWLDEKL